MPILEIIKYEGEPNVLVKKAEEEDFNTLSQLIVHETQEAVFFRNGKALDVFPPGRYTLETQNIPLLSSIVNLPTGGETPFHCEVYFVNKTMTLNLDWGTQDKAEVMDPKFNIILNIGARGALGLQVGDSRKFLDKLVGTSNKELTAEVLRTYFVNNISTRVKSYLTRIMSEVSFVVVNQQLDDISKALHEKLSEDLAAFGVKLVNFYLSAIHIPPEDKEKVKEALATASARSIEGYNWVDEQLADISKRYAANHGNAGNVAGMIAQMPVAFAFGQMLSTTVKPMTENVFSQATKAFSSSVPTMASAAEKKCECGAILVAEAVFCAKCGTPVPAVQADAFCHKCGNKIAGDDNFCPKCGTKIKKGEDDV